MGGAQKEIVTVNNTAYQEATPLETFLQWAATEKKVLAEALAQHIPVGRHCIP